MGPDKEAAAKLNAELLSSGTVRVVLKRGEKLKSADSNGFSDPYVKLQLGPQQHKSKTIKKTLDPQWDESFEFKGVVKDLLSQPLQLHVFDHDLFGKDDNLGTANVDLSSLLKARSGDFTAPLYIASANKGEWIGRVILSVSW